MMDAANEVYVDILLAPCPFCGSTSVSTNEVMFFDSGKIYKQASCRQCGAIGPIAQATEVSDYTLAIEAWNRRMS